MAIDAALGSVSPDVHKCLSTSCSQCHPPDTSLRLSLFEENDVVGAKICEQ